MKGFFGYLLTITGILLIISSFGSKSSAEGLIISFIILFAGIGLIKSSNIKKCVKCGLTSKGYGTYKGEYMCDRCRDWEIRQDSWGG